MDEEKIITAEEAKPIIEAVLFASGQPVTFAKLAQVIGMDEKTVRSYVTDYASEYETCGLPRGIQLLQLGNACQLVTKEVFAPYTLIYQMVIVISVSPIQRDMQHWLTATMLL